MLYETVDPFRVASLSSFHRLAVSGIDIVQSFRGIIRFLLLHSTKANATGRTFNYVQHITFLYFHFTMWPPSNSPPPPLSYFHMQAAPSLGIKEAYHYLKPGQSFMTDSIWPDYVYEASLDSKSNAKEQYEADTTHHSSDSEGERTRKSQSHRHELGRSNSCLLKVGHKIVDLHDPLDVRVDANGEVYSWDGALPYSRYIGTIATTLGGDGKDKRTEAEKEGKGDETQKSAAADIASRAN
jgi:hypothetical protein